ncbi:MAG: AI-2E family transporter [Hyphomicrobiaceae bacterium]
MLAESARQLSAMLIVAALLLAGLVLGKDVLIPLATATIIAFMLSPIVRWLAAHSIPEGMAVAGVMTLGLAAAIALALLLSSEVLTLTAKLNDYRFNIAAKVHQVASFGRGDGVIKRASESIDRISEIIAREVKPDEIDAIASDGKKKEPVVIASKAPENGPIATMQNAVEPLTKAGLTLLFTLFLLLQFEDLRDRIVRVLGTDNLSETTSAMSDAGARLSRLFLAQGIMNAAYGIVVGIGLAIAGIPGALLWGLLAGLMRFVPFVGSIIAAVPPIMLAAGVAPGWGLVVFTAAFFAIGELAMGQFVEPHVLGHRVGLSPFAMIAATAMWTLVWGPMGLLLAAPLTMCLVVVGRYVPSLSFITVLLGDEDPLTPQQIVYQRLLAGDELGVVDELEEAAEELSIAKVTDEIVLPALALAAVDVRAERVEPDKVREIRETMALAAELFIDAPTQGEKNGDTSLDRVAVVGARGELDLAAAKYLALVIRARCGRPASSVGRSSGLTALADIIGQGTQSPPHAIVIVSTGGVSQRQMRLMARRVEQHLPDTRVMILGTDSVELDLRALSPGMSTPAASAKVMKVPNAASLFALLRTNVAQASPEIAAAPVN